MVVDLFLYFTIYSFFGWLLETVYASVKQRKFINRGFLIGPFTPIYGFSAILIIISSKLIINIFGDYSKSSISLLMSIFVSTLFVTLLELITGYILEKSFNAKWWDYSEEPLNFKGYICLRFSLLWGILSFLLIHIVHPKIVNFVKVIPDAFKVFVAIFIFMYFIFDTYKSIENTLDLRKTIFDYSELPLAKYKEKILKYKRIFLAFPRLQNLNEEIKNRDVRSIINGGINKIKVKIKNRFQT